MAAMVVPASADLPPGTVLDAADTPFGYSLLDAARLTAVYNTGAANGSLNTPPPPALPFDVLVNGSNLTIPANTYLYVPIYFIDDSQVSLGTLPSDLNDQAADRQFVDAYLAAGGITSAFLDIDSSATPLTDDYINGLDTPPLLDGGGTHYFTEAAFVTPLAPGVHYIGLGGVQDGVAGDYQPPYTITVVPEPAAATAAVAGLVLLSRRTRRRAA